MSTGQLQISVNSLDKEIADMEKKKAEFDKKYAEFQSKINSTRKSITKSTSASIATSKLQQIGGWENDAAKKASESADAGKKIAEKRQKRNDAYVKLQKAQQEEQKKQEKSYKQMQTSYEQRIDDLSRQVLPRSITSHSAFVSKDEQYDVFISHAWEDKDSFVDEFVNELIALKVCPWYDKERITWGDSMRARIDDGLKKSKFGIVVISTNYIAEGKYWTKQELDGLFQLESVNGKTILPIWHDITKKEVIKYSPIIAGKLAMTTATMTPKEIAEELLKLLKKIETEEQNYADA